MSELTFNIGGRLVTASEVARYAAPAPKKATKDYLKRVHERDKAKQSDGFVVSGYSPNQVESAEQDHKSTQKAQAARIAAGGKLQPKEKIICDWNIESYLSKAKPKRVRSKPYEIAEAADQCAELARKAGWLRVSVEELMKG